MITSLPAPSSCAGPAVTHRTTLQVTVGADQGKRRELREEAEHRESERDRLDGVIKSKDKLRELGVGPQLASILSSTVPVRDLPAC